MSFDWPRIATFCESLPGVLFIVNYGKPEARANDRAFAGVSRFEDSFFVALDDERVSALLAEAPDTFWQSANITGWPVLYVRYESERSELVLAAVRDSYQRALAAPPRQKARRG